MLMGTGTEREGKRGRRLTKKRKVGTERKRVRGGEGGGEANMLNTTQKSCGRDVENGGDLG